MSSRQRLTATEFEAALEEHAADVRGLQILHLAFVGGVILLGMLTAFLSLSGPQGAVDRDPDATLYLILSGAHAAVAVLGGLVMGRVLPSAMLRMTARQIGSRSGDAAASSDDSSPASHLLAGLRGAMILRLAALEGPALFGLVICLLAGLEGDLGAYPLIWLNAISAVFLILFTVATYPTRDRLVDVFRLRIEPHLEDRSPADDR